MTYATGVAGIGIFAPTLATATASLWAGGTFQGLTLGGTTATPLNTTSSQAPNNPLGLLVWNLNGTDIQIPYYNAAATEVSGTIAAGTATLGTTLIASGAKATLVTVAAPNVLSTDCVMADFASDISGVTGFAPSANGMLTIIKFCTAGAVNFYVYNNTGAGITPGQVGSPLTGVVLNWRVVR